MIFLVCALFIFLLMLFKVFMLRCLIVKFKKTYSFEAIFISLFVAFLSMFLVF